MWGSLPPTYGEDASGWAGFTRFKEGFGTEFVEFVGSFDYVIQPTLYTLYNAAYAIRKKVL
jgi:lipid II:glycine glycyltransferase (peptidoglycan interpeptide bridge formation enzyme)